MMSPLSQDDFKSVKPIHGDDTPHDDYGLSLLAVIVDLDSELSSVTSRWNTSIEADNYLSKEDLQELLGPKFSNLDWHISFVF